MEEVLFKKITLTALNFWKTTGQTKKNNMSLVPDDSWFVLSLTGKQVAGGFINRLKRDIPTALQESLNDLFIESYCNGLWLWIAEYYHKEPEIFQGKLSFDFAKIQENPEVFIDKWDNLLESLDKFISEDVEPAIEAAKLLIKEHIRQQNMLHTLLTAEEFKQLYDDLGSAVIKGYLLPNLFQYKE